MTNLPHSWWLGVLPYLGMVRRFHGDDPRFGPSDKKAVNVQSIKKEIEEMFSCSSGKVVNTHPHTHTHTMRRQKHP